MEFEEISLAVHKDGQLENKKKNMAMAILLLVAGVVCIVAGFLTKALANVSFLCFSAGLILVIIGIIDLVTPSSSLVYKPTQETVKKSELNIAEKDRSKMLESIQSGDLSALKGMAMENSTSLKVVYYSCHSGKYLAVQPQEFVPYQYDPFQETTFFHDGEAISIGKNA